MATIIGTRPNHYEVLGLTPAATDEEIREAFAREIGPFRPRAIGGLAEISIAYEALRDTAKRRAYDASIGIEPEPAPPAPRAEGWHPLGSVHVGPVGQAAVAAAPVAAPRLEPEALPKSQSVPKPEPVAEAETYWPPLADALPSIEERPVEWGRPAFVIGGLFAGVALLGAGLGVYASRDVEPAKAESTAAPVAPRAIAPAVEQKSEVPQPAASAVRPERLAQPRPAPARIDRREPEPKIVTDNQVADDIPDIPTEQLAAQVSPAAEPASTMPLSNAAIARTIGRIGYSCGSVASMDAVEGADGVFKVNCTSGDSYRAAPANGRYRFKRWSGR